MGRRWSIKAWRNGPRGSHTTEVTWYAEGEAGDKNIRLVLIDGSGAPAKDLYPKSPEEATKIFNRFQMLSPRYSDPNAKRPVIEMLLDSLSKEATNGADN